jgi:hypothetical protein
MFSTICAFLPIVLLGFVWIHRKMSLVPTDFTDTQSSAFHPSWEAFKAVDLDAISQPDRAQSEAPQELLDSIDDSTIPEKLKQILTWSLDFQPAPGDTNIASGGPQDGTTVVSCRPSQIYSGAGLKPKQDNDKESSEAAIQHATDRFSDTHSAHSEHRPSQRPMHRRNVSHGVLSSTRGLINTLKSRTAKHSSPRAEAASVIPKSPILVECTSCMEDINEPDTSKLSCNHPYCQPCLTTLIMTALENEASFPPKCCLTEVPPQRILASLDAQQRLRYKDKAAEFALPPQDRRYCPNSSCLKWIRPVRLPRISTANERCPFCSTKICVTCRGLAHKNGAECPQDFGLEA